MLDFNRLDPGDFEKFVAVLLHRHRGLEFEAFAEGPDGGIDLRHVSATGQQTIVQCKRYDSNATRAVLRELRAAVPRLQLNEHDHYIVATTVRLTPHRKMQIMQLCTPWIRSTADIIGRDDLQHLADCHVDALKAFPELWLSTLPIVEHFFNKRIVHRSDQFLRELPDRLEMWVNTPAYERAQVILSRAGWVLLSGQPGVGKTHLAQILALECVSDNYDPVVISDSFGEIESAWNESEKQVFIFDDFLGQISLGRLSVDFREASRVVAVLRRIRDDPDKRLILTTREYVLAEATESHERIAWLREALTKSMVLITDLPRHARASIVVKHLRRAGIKREAVTQLLSDPRRFDVVDHSRFSPRAIAHVAQFRVGEGGDICGELLDELDNPWRTWRAIFSNLAAEVRWALLAIYSLGGYAAAEDVSVVWCQLVNQMSARTFSACVRALSDSMIAVDEESVTGGRRTTRLRAVDPSVIDYLESVLAQSGPELAGLIAGIAFVEQLVNLDNPKFAISTAQRKTAFDRGADLCFGPWPVLADERLYSSRAWQLARVGRGLPPREVSDRVGSLILRLLEEQNLQPDNAINVLLARELAGCPWSTELASFFERAVHSILDSDVIEDWDLLDALLELGPVPEQTTRRVEVVASLTRLTSVILGGEHGRDDLEALLDVLGDVSEALLADVTELLNQVWSRWYEFGGDDLIVARENMAELVAKHAWSREQQYARLQSDALVDKAFGRLAF